MKQLIYKDSIYIIGNIKDVLMQLKKLTVEYKTVRALLKVKTKGL